MLQFMAILGVSTFFSVVAYKIQHDGIQEKHNLIIGSELGTLNNSQQNERLLTS